EMAEAIAEPHARLGDARQRALALSRIGDGPRAEPGVDGLRGARIDLVGNDVGKERELEAPPLHVLVADGLVGQLVAEIQPRAVGVLRERDRHARAAGGNRLAAREAVAEDEAIERRDLENLARRLGAVGMTDVDAPAGPRIDRRPGAPPRRPPRA